MMEKDCIICGDAKQALRALADEIVDLTVTSPPYFRHRDYGVNGQLGREATVAEYIKNIRAILQELLRVTAKTGACFFVVGDTYQKGRRGGGEEGQTYTFHIRKKGEGHRRGTSVVRDM